MRNSIGYYAGFLMLLAVLGGVWLAVWHIVRVVRKVRTLISQATDESPADELECGCPRDNRPRYFCMSCDAARCADHKDPHACPPEHDRLLAVFNAAKADDWTVWESECSDLQKLASKLGAKR